MSKVSSATQTTTKKNTRAGTGCFSATERLEESIEERIKGRMNWDHHEQFLDLHREDIDPDVFAAALAVQHMRRLLASGGSEYARPDDESALQPKHLEPFLAWAVEMAKKPQRFEHEWRRLQRVMPRVKIAWERGQALFQEDLARAMTNQEEMEYLCHTDFAEDCYAAVDARRTYPHDHVLPA